MHLIFETNQRTSECDRYRIEKLVFWLMLFPFESDKHRNETQTAFNQNSQWACGCMGVRVNLCIDDDGDGRLMITWYGYKAKMKKKKL